METANKLKTGTDRDTASIAAKKQKKNVRKIFTDEPDFTEDDLTFYYGYLFPFNDLARWLSYKNDSASPITLHNDPTFFSRREFSFACFPKGSNRTEEIYVRWNFFNDADELRHFILSNQSIYPHKLDIGAVYNKSGKNRENQRKTLKPVEKEIVFDIDMNDYDAIRTCCKDKKVCRKCWKFLSIAMKVLHRALEEDFGFKQILWVFSGRRGVHAWVCDAHARCLPNEERAAVADYLNIITGSAGQKQQVLLSEHGTHPMIDHAVEICQSHFEEIAIEQQLFHSQSLHVQKVIDHLSASNLTVIVAELQQWMKRHAAFTSKQFYDYLLVHSKVSKDSVDTPKWLKEIILSFCYPRIDINVTKEINHLLKAPFCVHFKTGRICVPINIKDIDYFNPEYVPTIVKLREEYDSSKENDSPKTSLEEYLHFFRSHFIGNIIRSCSDQNKSNQRKAEKVDPSYAFSF